MSKNSLPCAYMYIRIYMCTGFEGVTRNPLQLYLQAFGYLDSTRVKPRSTQWLTYVHHTEPLWGVGFDWFEARSVLWGAVSGDGCASEKLQRWFEHYFMANRSVADLLAYGLGPFTPSSDLVYYGFGQHMEHFRIVMMVRDLDLKVGLRASRIFRFRPGGVAYVVGAVSNVQPFYVLILMDTAFSECSGMRYPALGPLAVNGTKFILEEVVGRL